MKYSIGLAVLLGLSVNTFGQDTIKSIKTTTPNAATAIPRVSLQKVKTLSDEPSISGEYVIDRYSVQAKRSNNTKIIQAVGSDVSVTNELISGSSIDSIDFKISDVELMSIEDYLFRIFGVVPDEIPADLPVNLYVFKTNNLSCYGIGKLSDGTLILPREGILLYFKPKA